MLKKNIMLAVTAMALLFLALPAMGQSNQGLNPQASYGGSSLFQSSPQTRAYYPYWNSYLDNLQQEGGYQAVTGNYGNSMPVTSYYPSRASSTATTPQATTPNSNMYYNPSEYYQHYPNQRPPGQQTYQPPNQGAQYQPPTPAPQPSARTAPRPRPSAKRKRSNAREEPYPSRQQITAEQQAYVQLVARTQQQAQMPQQGYQRQQAGQQAYYQQQQQQQLQQQQQQAAPQQQQAAPQQPAYSEDPLVRRAQQEAYERAVARQRAMEQSAKQQAAMQEMQQAQQMYETAQGKVREQEERQQAMQKEFRRKATNEAYEGLRAAQKRYYDLMGVSDESGRPPQENYAAQAPPRAGPPPGYQPGQPPMGARATYGPPAGVNTGARPPVTTAPQQVQPTQATPLYAQQQPQQQAPQQQQSSGGLWSTLKSVFSGPTYTGNQRGMFSNQRTSQESSY